MRRLYALIVLATAMVLGFGVGPALATIPMTADGIVTDSTGTLDDGDIALIEEAVDALRAEDGVTLWLVVVNDFSNPTDGFEWATEFAERNRLVSTDVVMYVGLSTGGTGEAGLNVARDLPLTNEDIERIQSRDMIPKLDDGDVAGAAVATADGLRTTLGGEAGDDSGNENDGSSASSGGGIGALIVILILIGVVVVGLGIFFLVRRARENARRAAQAAAEEQSIEELAMKAATQLVRTDDLMKTAEQDAAFAEAEFGADTAAPFRTALEAARAQVREAFELQGRLLDHIPDSDEERKSWNTRILELTHEARQQLAAESQRFEALRAMERDAPRLLAEVTARAEQTATRLHASESVLQTLHQRYAPHALATLADSITQVDGLVQLAVAEAQEAGQFLRSGKSGMAAVDIGDAQEALGQAAQLLDAIERTRTDLEHASTSIRAEITGLQGDVDRLSSFETSTGLTASNRAAIAHATEVIAQAEHEGDAPPDPLTTLQALRSANSQLDAALAATTEEHLRLEDVRQRVERALPQAHAQVRSLQDFVSTHRGALDATPRTRLAQAETELARVQPLLSTDSDAALAALNRAIDLSRTGTSIATEQVAQQRSSVGFPTSGYDAWGGSSSRGSSRGSSMGDAIVGGIIGGLLSGGGSRGGFGGSRGGFGGSRGGFGSRGRSSSFGGSSRRSGGGFRASGGFRGGGRRR